MHIYIDESGVFGNPHQRENIASVLAALVIPSNVKVKLFREFKSLSTHWPKANDEVKGRLLNEPEIAATTDLLRKYDCLVEANVIDMGRHSDEQLTEYQAGMCRKIAAIATKDTPEILNQEVLEIAEAIKKPRSPIFVEAFLLMRLIPRVLNNAVNYYARRIPKELKSFHWLIDGKDKETTHFERAWQAIMFLGIAAMSIDVPTIRFLDGGDFSYFGNFIRPPEEIPDWLRKDAHYQLGLSSGINLRAIFDDFKFGDSKQNVGLQLADVIANALQRALNNRLREDGYLGLGFLMVKQRYSAIEYGCLDPTLKREEIRIEASPLGYVINDILSQAKPMWLGEKDETRLLKKQRRHRKQRFGS